MFIPIVLWKHLTHSGCIIKNNIPYYIHILHNNTKQSMQLSIFNHYAIQGFLWLLCWLITPSFNALCPCLTSLFYSRRDEIRTFVNGRDDGELRMKGWDQAWLYRLIFKLAVLVHFTINLWLNQSLFWTLNLPKTSQQEMLFLAIKRVKLSQESDKNLSQPIFSSCHLSSVPDSDSCLSAQRYIFKNILGARSDLYEVYTKQ